MKDVKRKEEPREERPEAGDFYVVASQLGTWYVTSETAAHIGRMLDRRRKPRWLKFVDVSGSRVWLKARKVESVYESTGAVRARDREFHYRRGKEERLDRRWDDDD
jgi:hypothetical protein